VPEKVRTTWPACCARKPLSRRAVLKYRGRQRRWTQHWRWRVASGSVLCVRLRAEAQNAPPPPRLTLSLHRSCVQPRRPGYGKRRRRLLRRWLRTRRSGKRRTRSWLQGCVLHWVVLPSVCDARHACVGVSRAHTQSLTHGVHTLHWSRSTPGMRGRCRSRWKKKGQPASTP
jgi:hypothetical protein